MDLVGTLGWRFRSLEAAMQLGCHLSIAEGFTKAGEHALSIGARTFQFFIRNPRGAGSSPLIPEDVAGLERLMNGHHLTSLLAHAPYTLNPCSSKPATRAFAIQAMQEDLEKLSGLPCSLYNFHPGNHTGQGVETGIAQTVDCLNSIHLPNDQIRLLLETMAGCGTEIGSSFEEIATIMEGVENRQRMGVCLDTCHIFAAGYDIRSEPEEVLRSFDETIGLENLYAIHLNDSVHPLGSRKDRHANIGEGEIGLEALVRFITMEPLRSLPIYLETRNDLAGHGREIAMLQEACSKMLN